MELARYYYKWACAQLAQATHPTNEGNPGSLFASMSDIAEAAITLGATAGKPEAKQLQKLRDVMKRTQLRPIAGRSRISLLAQ